MPYAHHHLNFKSNKKNSNISFICYKLYMVQKYEFCFIQSCLIRQNYKKNFGMNSMLLL